MTRATIPVGQIEWLVDRLSVVTPPAEVESDIRTRCADHDWPAEAVERAVKVALRQHTHNRDLYIRVRDGRL